MPRGRPDIANTAIRIFLQEMGVAYDEERGLTPYRTADFAEVRDFFGQRCCYCGVEFGPGAAANQDHLIPINKTDLGLHAWGNVVAACAPCNNARQRKDWREYVIERAGPDARERADRVKAFLAHYGYDPALDLRPVAEELYDEVGGIAMTLINAKIKRFRQEI